MIAGIKTYHSASIIECKVRRQRVESFRNSHRLDRAGDVEFFSIAARLRPVHCRNP
jgi:hypothetical protein